MSDEAQLEWESRAARPAAYASLGAAGLLLASLVYGSVAFRGETPDTVAWVGRLVGQPTDFLIVGGLVSTGIALTAAPLFYLFRATRHRRPALPTAARLLVVVAPVAFGALTFATRVDVVVRADDFRSAGPLTPERATEVLRGGDPVLQSLFFAGRLAFGLAVVLLSINAMRAGLLSRFMGIIGVVVGVLSVIPILEPPILLQLFWLGALGMLFLDRWPGRRGPAWEAGGAVPWPTAAEQRAELDRAREGGEVAESEATVGAGGDASAEGERGPDPGASGRGDAASRRGSNADTPAGEEHPVPRRRKRKRRT